MLQKVTHLTIFVHDQNDALEFYRDKVGLKVHTDVLFGLMRWLTLCTEAQPDFEIVVMQADTPEEKALVGNQAAKHPLCVFSTPDCKGTYQEMVSRGVKFIKEPTQELWGVEALFVDLYGNVFDLVQPIN